MGGPDPARDRVGSGSGRVLRVGFSSLQLLEHKILSHLKTEFEAEFGLEFRHDFELYFDY